MFRFKQADRGQALAEFAIIIVVLLVLILFIVDVGRIGWAWVTVQSAARAGARYASTGNSSCSNPPNRLDCVISRTHHHLNTLPLHEDPQAPWGDDEAYRIEVWGIDEDGQGPSLGNPGAAGKPVVVRAYYWVPIVNPLFRPIRQSIRVNGQVSMVNELFDSMGGASAGVGLPPPLPDLPEARATDTPTPSPTFTPSATPMDTPTPTNTPVPPVCDTHFEELLIFGDASLAVTGSVYSPPATVFIFDMNDEVSPGVPRLIGTATLTDTVGHGCPGFMDVPLTSPLIPDHVIKVENQTDFTYDTDFVRSGPPTATPTSTSTPSPTPTPSPTATPVDSFLEVRPFCAFGSDIEFTVRGGNWTDSSSPINLFWIEAGESPKLQTIIPVGHPANFVQTWKFSDVKDGTHTVEARSSSVIKIDTLEVPCSNPVDLVASNITLPDSPDDELEPFEIRVSISNQGSVDINRQFFVDVFIDPTEVFTDSIPLSQSSGYQAVSGLQSGYSTIITFFHPGLPSSNDGDHEIWAMVDSTKLIAESTESNNVNGPHTINVDQKDSDPTTPTPIPAGSEQIAGVVHVIGGSLSSSQSRAFVWLVQISDGMVVSTTSSDSTGYYEFNNAGTDSYEVWACMAIDNQVYVGSRSGIVPPAPLVDVFMTVDQSGCPYLP